jgi:hypothetical protein
VVGNVDACGKATDAVDQRCSGDQNIPYWTLKSEAVDSGWKVDGFKDDEWKGGEGGPDAITVTTPPLYHGLYSFKAIAVDAVGNENDDGTELSVVVSSGPSMHSLFRRVTTEDGTIRVAYERPSQWV